MSSSKLMYFLKLATILILSQYYQSICAETPAIVVNEDILESMLQVAKHLRGSEYAVWRVQGNLPVHIQENEIYEDPPAPHIIIQKFRDHIQEWNLCYWTPRHEQRSEVSRVGNDILVSATYIMAMDQILNEHSSHHYRRESKNLIFDYGESPLEKCLGRGFRHYLTELSGEKHLVLLEEQSYILIRQGYPLFQTLGASNCAVLYFNNVFVFCGNLSISHRLRSMAHLLGQIVLQEVQIFNPVAKQINIDYANLGTSQQELDNVVKFFHKIQIKATSTHLPILASYANENRSIIKWYWNNQWVINITNDTEDDDGVKFTSFIKGPLRRSMLKSDECHLVFFSEKHSEGFFIWIGTQSSIEDRLRASIKVEQAINKYYKFHWSNKLFSEAKPRVIIESREPLEFKTVFMDWFDEDNLNFGYSLKESLNKNL